jgi:hypothetical protein
MENPDDTMRAYAATLPAPEFPNPAFVTPPRLAEATVAICTTAALHATHDQRYTGDDTSYRVIDRAARDLVLGHWSPNFDRAGFAIDHNVVFPIDRLEELARGCVIGGVAPRHLAFAGNQEDTLTKVRLDSGPHAAALLRDDGVDVVLLTPV